MYKGTLFLVACELPFGEEPVANYMSDVLIPVECFEEGRVRMGGAGRREITSPGAGCWGIIRAVCQVLQTGIHTYRDK